MLREAGEPRVNVTVCVCVCVCVCDGVGGAGAVAHLLHGFSHSPTPTKSE
jgi:chemotaxis receptor (MCP) glutamine deamidase CheD